MRLRQILTNLLGNAIKFTDRGEIVLSAHMDRQDGESVSLRFEVRDTGIGIPPELQSSIFDSFTQADESSSRRFGGTGLGLPISKQLAELMGGGIGVESSPGHGTTFWFTARFERVTSRGAAPKQTEVVPVAAEETAVLRGLRVLLVEDNPVNQVLGSEILKGLGCRVTCADDGQAALDALSAHPQDLVLMDCQMPAMDGYEATRRIRSEETRAGKKPIPILALTASVMQGDRALALEAGMNDFLGKPFTRRELEKMLIHWSQSRCERLPGPVRQGG